MLDSGPLVELYTSALGATLAEPRQPRPATAVARRKLEPAPTPSPPQAPAVDDSRMLRLPAVMDRTGISRPTIYRLMQKGEFPKAAKIGGSSVWPEREVTAYIEKAMEAR
jgi:prophage regulatory protein